MTISPFHSLVDWLYNNPSWLVGLVIVAITVAYGLLGVVVVHHAIARNVRQEHNDLTGAASAIIGTVAAVLLAFISVATWETFSRDQDITDNESTAIMDVFFESSNIGSEVLRKSVQSHLRSYANIVIADEWPAQRTGSVVLATMRPGRSQLLAIDRDLVAMHPQTIGDGNVQSRLMTSLDQLSDHRRQRVTDIDGHVNADVWGVILAGTALAIASTWMFGPRSLGMHMVLTSFVAASMALVIVLIVTTDYPFRGAVSISTAPYQEALAVMQEGRLQPDTHGIIPLADTLEDESRATRERRSSRWKHGF